MQPNPILRKLGFADDDRVVIIHTDDIGMCQASLSAFADLVDFGLISSGATMVPCPWFLQAAAFCREHPEVDMGVHLTLTSEWETYRWGPISTRDPATGLMDEQGYFYRGTAPVQEHADPAAAQVELEAQIKRALQAGMRPTHADTHMGAVAHPKFIPGYIQLALQYRLPLMVFRMDEAGWLATGLDAETAAMATQMVATLESMGVPLLDHIMALSLEEHENRLEHARQTLSALDPGVTHFIIHPSKDTPELREITPDWRCRVADYQAFTSPEMRNIIRDLGIQTIGYRALQELMPA